MSLPAKLTIESITSAMERIAPLRLAESWDNVGLLLESPVTTSNARRILLTVDLTEAVVQEALETPPDSQTAAIICYHPPLFRALKSVTLSNPLQRCMLKCIANGISIYSPHTALDSVKGGVNDWLASLLQRPNEVSRVDVLGELKESPGTEGAGVGRLVAFEDGLPLSELVERVKAGLHLNYVHLARSAMRSDDLVKTVAICAGSGGSVVGGTKADLYFTGEMGHHEVLAAVANGSHVMLCGHSNTERGYLPVLKASLEAELAKDLPDSRIDVVVSKRDMDPLEIV